MATSSIYQDAAYAWRRQAETTKDMELRDIALMLAEDAVAGGASPANDYAAHRREGVRHFSCRKDTELWRL